MTNGKSMGYPTLESIYWRYILSQEAIGQPNDNFTYQTMINYVNGLGDYWIRLVEQMIPASTIWSTGVKYENSAFHRQKHAWRRQRGCQIVPVPCKPCVTTTNFLPIDCPVQSTECPVYPLGTVSSFTGILGKVVTNYIASIGKDAGSCNFNSINSEWFVDLRINDTIIAKNKFFTGVGYGNNSFSSPNNSQWFDALIDTLDGINDDGYDYYLTENNTKVVVFNSICSESAQDLTLTINVGINLKICCN